MIRATQIQLKPFAVCRRGSVAVISAVAITALVLGAGIAVDYGSMVSKRKTLQAVGDAAAIGGAREMSLANADQSQITSVVNQLIALKLDTGDGSLSISVDVDEVTASVEVTLSESWTPIFMGLVSESATPVTISSTAQVAGSGKVCVVGLETTQNRTVFLRRNAQLTANGCNVYSNSTGRDSIRVDDNGKMTAAMICSAGGAYGAGGAYSPFATTDCPPIPDPLEDRVPPVVGACDHQDVDASEDVTLSPGVYCNGLTITGNATLEPGNYIIKEGTLLVGGSGVLQGENVSFYFIGTNPTTGKASNLIFGPNSTISLTAPKDGDMAGLLIFEDRNQPESTPFRISSNDARLLLGTVYISRGNLIVDANAPVADQSAYTAIVARKLLLDAGPNLVLNTDYSTTDIPVPGALAGIGGRIVLKN